MKAINEIKMEVETLFAGILLNIKIKTYFSYYGIFKNSRMIALYKHNRLFLRLSADNIAHLQQSMGLQPLKDKKLGLLSKKFYQLPSSIIMNSSYFADLINATLEELEQEQKMIQARQQNQIRYLPNMNIKFERLLKKIGIYSVQEFKAIGGTNTFIKLVQQGIDPTEDLLFKLNGAISRQYIYTFTQQQKQLLLQEANNALYSAGLRKRFYVQIQ